MPDAPAIVDAQIRAYERGDAHAFAVLYAEDAVCSELPSGRIVANGRAEIERVWGALFAQGPRCVRIVERIARGCFVIDVEQVTLPKAGKLVEAIAIYQVGDRGIERVWFPMPADIRALSADRAADA